MQAHQYLGSYQLSITGNSSQPFLAHLTTSPAVASGQVVAATATAPDGNTSAFSAGASLSPAFVVTNTADDGIGSLREAIENANAMAGMNMISFDVPSQDAPYQITLASPLPTITDPLLIDGTTQPGYVGAPVIQINGHTNTISNDGLDLGAGSAGSRIRGLDIYGFASGAAIDIQSNNDVIQSNYLGTDVTGTQAPDPNKYGILINGGTGNQIGGLSTVGNLISGNTLGVLIEGSSSGNVLQGNQIGTDITGKTNLANTGDGVQISASNNTIGGTAAGVGNIIAFNSGAGVDVKSGTGDAISQNSIFANASGIVLVSGANHNQAPPTLTEVNSAGSSTTIVGSLTGFAASTPFVLEFFASAPGDPSLPGQAHVFLGNATVTTNSSGDFSFTETYTTAVAIGQSVTATATSGSTAANPNDTSTFATSVPVASPFVVTNTSNSGTGSLDQAILNANMNPGSGPEVISFDIPGTGPFTIAPTSPLPTITVPVLLDGTTEPGYSGKPLIQIQGSSSLTDGLVLGSTSSTSSMGSTIKGLDLYDFSKGAGIHIETNTNAVQSTYLGTNATGMQTGKGNLDGVLIDGGSNNTIGGTSVGNLISGNSVGVLIQGSATGNVLQGNEIGTDNTGKTGLENSGDGVQISASNNTVGGTTAGVGNIIAFNGGAGVDVKSGTGDAIRENSIFANASGIVLATGANNNQPAPTVGSVISAGNSTTISYSLNGGTGTQFVLDFFASAPGDPPGKGQAHVFLGSTTVTTGGSITVSTGVAAGQSVTATATSSSGDTSEFATSVLVANPFLVTNTNSSGSGSLDQAILNANATSPGSTPDAITFNISGTAPFTITGALPTITVPVLLDGTTQPLYSGTPLIQIQGSSSLADGLVLGSTSKTSSAGSTIRGLAIYDYSAGAGIDIQTANNVVQSTYLGTNATGTTTGLGNLEGILIDGGSTNTIGAITVGNLISGNTIGVLIQGSGTGNVVLGNEIGTDITGSLKLPNTGDGVQISASNNTVGGTISGAANLIAYNGGAGVDVRSGAGNAIRENSIFANASGIVLATGANNNQAAPTLTGATSIAGTTTIQGSLSGFAVNTTFIIDFFASQPGDSTSVPGQAHLYLGTIQVTTDSSGNVNFTTVPALSIAAAVGQTVTATATSNSTAANPNDTSELAPSVKVLNPFLVTNTQSSGLGSLSQAIINANNNSPPQGGTDAISFNISGTSPITITLTSALPTITVPVTIDGRTQGKPGYSGPPLIQIQGSRSLSDGLVLAAGSTGSTIEGLAINGFATDGILVQSSDNTIGGTASGAGNVITGITSSGAPIDTDYGVEVNTGTGNQILSNLIYDVANQGIVLTNGGNDSQAAPTIVAATSVPDQTTITFDLGATPTSPYTVQFFASSTTGTGPAQQFLGQTVITPATGTASYTTTLQTGLQTGQTVTATTTSSSGDTSPFATSVTLASPFLVSNTGDSGVGSLRQVINDVNQYTTQQTVTFNIPTSDFELQ